LFIVSESVRDEGVQDLKTSNDNRRIKQLNILDCYRAWQRAVVNFTRRL